MTAHKQAIVRALVAVVLLGIVPITAAAPAGASPFCGIRWGSLYKSRHGTLTYAPITNVRSGQHACFDRLVIDVRDFRTAPNALFDPPDVTAYYVPVAATCPAPPSAPTYTSPSGARLCLSVGAPAQHRDTREWTYRPKDPNRVVNVSGYRTFRRVSWISSDVITNPDGFTHASTVLGVDVRARLPFRVFTLQDGPASRVVLDVAHRW
jgi:hypothetical protein